MTLVPWPSTPASALRTLLVAALSAVALLLWAPATSLARDAEQTEQGESFKTALVSAGVLGRGAGYGTGHGSAAVRGLQFRLRTLGFRPGPVDGLYGPLTQGAVERFQVARGLLGDGVVGPATMKRLVARAPGRKSSPAGSSRTDRPARHRAAPEQRTGRDRPPATEAPAARAVAPPRAAPEPQPSDGLAPELAAGLGALAVALLLGGAWLLAGRRRGAPAGRPDGSPRPSFRLGMVCAALLAVFALGAVAGALFATQASPGNRDTAEVRSASALPPRSP